MSPNDAPSRRSCRFYAQDHAKPSPGECNASIVGQPAPVRACLRVTPELDIRVRRILKNDLISAQGDGETMDLRTDTGRSNVSSPSRRRLLRMMAAAGVGGLAKLAGLRGSAAAAAGPAVLWRGRVLGAEAEIRAHHADRDHAEQAVAAVIADVRRLEAIFSLHRDDSALSRLNRHGRLEPVPPDLHRLLGQCRDIHARTDGAFDPTVQPLWELYTRHFSSPGADPAGPPRAAIDAVIERLGMDKVTIAETALHFDEPGMGLTLNGIAQGFITDRAHARFAAAGLRHVLIDLGEFRALGSRPDGDGWRIGIADPQAPWQLIERVRLGSGRALATSAGAGAPFDAAMRHHHIFDPKTGRSGRAWRSVSVLAPTATLADALSTAIAAAPADRARAILAQFHGTRAILLSPEGRLVRLSAGDARG
ncbi:MAG: FAD:protein FMN transferase [Alphaproteobacteria bacterium]|nr:MAG: FAD:protein FMN transferase [Alphaproteobacteria bacterium]